MNMMLLLMMIECELLFLPMSLATILYSLSPLCRSNHLHFPNPIIILTMSNDIDCSARFEITPSILNRKIAHSTNRSRLYQPREQSRSLAGYPCSSPRSRSLPAMRAVSKHFGEVLQYSTRPRLWDLSIQFAKARA